MLQRALITLVAGVVLAGLPHSAAWAQQDIRWGTPPVGTAGHKALVTLANLLNKEMPKYRISVLPTAGAIATVKGFATKELDGDYGSDVAFNELATDSGRFKGFKQRVQRWPVQSFWSNTIEVGLAVHVRNKDKIKKWGDLAGKRVFAAEFVRLKVDVIFATGTGAVVAKEATSIIPIVFTLAHTNLSAHWDRNQHEGAGTKPGPMERG